MRARPPVQPPHTLQCLLHARHPPRALEAVQDLGQPVQVHEGQAHGEQLHGQLVFPLHLDAILCM